MDEVLILALVMFLIGAGFGIGITYDSNGSYLLKKCEEQHQHCILTAVPGSSVNGSQQ